MRSYKITIVARIVRLLDYSFPARRNLSARSCKGKLASPLFIRLSLCLTLLSMPARSERSSRMPLLASR